MSVNAVQLCGSSMHHSWMSDCGVANVTTLDSAPVGQVPPSSSIPILLPCPSNGMLPSNPTMSSLPTPCTIESPALSPSQRCGHLLRRPQSSSIPTTPAAFSSTRSTLSLDPTVPEPSTMHRMDLMLCRCRMCPAPYCDQLQHHWPPPLHFAHVHVQALHSSWNMVLDVISAAASLPTSSRHCDSNLLSMRRTALLGGPPDPESDTDDIVISVFINKIINPDKSFGSSDPMCILLSSLLVEHTAPNIHDSNMYCCLCWPWGLAATTKPTRAVQDSVADTVYIPYGGAYSHSPIPWSRTWAWVICPPLLPPQTGNPGSITEIECTLLSGSAEQDALNYNERITPQKLDTVLPKATPIMGVVAK
ncbi:hypothetical protein EMCRGX_G026312 [Ephydatia muelleri]